MIFFKKKKSCLTLLLGPLSQALQCAHTMRNIGQNTFHHRAGSCALTCNGATTLTILPCEIRSFPQGILGHRSSFAAYGLALHAGVCIEFVSIDDRTHEISNRNLLSGPHCCYRRKESPPRCCVRNFLREVSIKSDPYTQSFEAFFTLSPHCCCTRHCNAAKQIVLRRRAPCRLTPINV